MKKLSLLGALWLSVIIGFAAVSYSAQTCANTDFFCYESGPIYNQITPARLDAAGNLTTLGYHVIGTKAVLSSSNLRLTGTGVPLSPTSTFVNLVSSGALSYGPAVLNISTATAVDGQYLILIATSTTNAITISTGAATGVAGVDTSIVITTNPTSFIFNALTSLWYEIGKL